MWIWRKKAIKARELKGKGGQGQRIYDIKVNEYTIFGGQITITLFYTDKEHNNQN